MAGAADRCVIPEYPFDIEHLAELLVYDRNRHPSKYAVALVSEGARMTHHEGMSLRERRGRPVRPQEARRHRRRGLGRLKDVSAKFNGGRRINVVNQRLGYLVRSGDPDALDSIVPMAFGNLALDLVLQGISGRLVSLRNGVYDNVPIDVVTGRKKVVDVNKYYNTKRLRPIYSTFSRQPTFIMTSDV